MSNLVSSILIVEDSPTQAQQLAAQLTQYDIEVTVAENGAQGLRIASILTPDLIVLDVNMPKMNGYQMCQRIRRDKETKHIPIILFTADESPEAIKKGTAVGANGYIVKGETAFANLVNILKSYNLLPPELVSS